MPTCNVIGNLINPDGSVATSVEISARVVQPFISSAGSVVIPQEISTTTNTSGNFSIAVEQSVSVVFTINYPIASNEVLKKVTYTANIPAATSAQFESIIITE